MSDELQQELDFGEAPRRSDSVSINDRCAVCTADGHRVVVVCGMVIAEYAVGDRMAEAHAMVSLVEQGWADQCDVARVFGCSVRTLRRHQRRFEDGGLRALGRDCGFPCGRRRMAASRVQTLQRLKAAGHSNREVGRILGVTEKAVRKLLRRMGWKERVAVQMPLIAAAPGADPNLSAFSCGPHQEPASHPSPGADPNLSACPQQATKERRGGQTDGATTEPSSVQDEDRPVSADTDPSDRRMDRLLAYLGLLDDAAPLFARAARVPKAGVLLAVPAILETGVLDAAREVYGSIGPAFYGLRTTVVALLLLALLRIKRPEALKEHSPEDLGRVLGLDRAPEVKTLRRKLKFLAARGRASRFCRALASRRVAARGAAMGFLYVDGHVRVYHGKHEIPKTHVARMRLPMPSVTDYWVNDTSGDPLFVVTAEANASLVKMLPAILGEVRSLVRPRRVTVVFDRGGFSPTLFHELIQDGFDILTYRKGRFRSVPKRSFSEQTATLDGRKVAYTLADQTVFLRLRKGRLRLRQVTRLTDSGHQTPILTSRRDIAAVEVAFRMFERWRQENYL